MVEYIDFQKTNQFWLPLPVGQTMEMVEYQAEHQIAGDTDSTMLMVPKELHEALEDENDLIEFCDDVCSFTNECFSDYIGKVFNIPEERRPIIAADREVIADKSLFLKKKMYIMHVIDEEGKRTDKLKIMGVEIKKSDTSPFVTKMITELVNMILEECTNEQLVRRVNEFKREFYSAHYSEVMRPTNCKKLFRDEQRYLETGTYKDIFWVSKAVMMYNDMCGPRDTKITAGQRVGVLYLKGSVKCIAYPYEDDNTPEWLDELVLDYDVMWEKANKKVENYLIALGWDIKSKKKELKKSLFGIGGL